MRNIPQRTIPNRINTACIPPRPGLSNPTDAGMVKRYHASFPSLSYEFDSRYPLQSLQTSRTG